MKPSSPVYIVGYGAYVPVYRVKDEEIARVWGKQAYPIEEKSVIGLDQDSITMAVEAAKYALKRAKIDPQEIGAVFVGTESKPYAVKPCATVVAEAIGATPNIIAVDMEFACRAGTTAMQCVIGLVASGMIKYGLVIGVDAAQGRPGDELEFTAGCGAAAFILGSTKNESIALIEASFSYVTDTPDFWRREGEHYPRHAHRFTGEPAYFHHIVEASRRLLDFLGRKPEDYDYAVFHQPNVKFPLRVAQKLGFKREQVQPGLVVAKIGNTYAASSLMGLAAVLDVAKPGQKIFAASFGSGAGSDAFSIVVLEGIEAKRNLAPTVKKLVETRKYYLSYAEYAKHRGKIRVR